MATGRGSESSPGVSERTTVERRSERELVVARTFDCPARMLFDAWTRPDLLRRWWAPRSRGVTLFTCEADVRVGGSYRYVFGRDPKRLMEFSGTYKEVTPPTRLVWTQVYAQAPSAGEATITATFEEQGGRTRLVLHQLFPSKEALDGAVASAMEDGVRETFEQLQALIRGGAGAGVPASV